MVRTSLRIDDKLYDKLVKIAEKDKRSLNAEINFIIEKYIESVLWQIKNTIK